MAKSPFLWFVAASAIACASHSQEASTQPVGFQTVTLKGSNYNLIGVNFLRPVIVSGALESANGISVTDDQGDFSNTLPAGASYWLELVDGPNQGSWSIVSPNNATALRTVTNLASYVTAGVKYEIRSAPTLADLFGATNAKGLKAGTSLTADLIWIPNDEGGFDKAFYAAATPPFLTAGWRMIGSGNADMSQVPVYHIEGLIIERRGTTDLEVFFDGAVKMTSSVIPVTSGFNYVQRSFPIGTTLGNSGLTSQVQAGSATTADILWMPNGAGGYNKYFMATENPPNLTAGWRAIGSGNADQASVPLTSGFIIERRAAATNMKLTPVYGDL